MGLGHSSNDCKLVNGISKLATCVGRIAEEMRRNNDIEIIRLKYEVMGKTGETTYNSISRMLDAIDKKDIEDIDKDSYEFGTWV